MTDEVDARAQLSEMSEITEATIAQCADRDADLDELYRACPSAFWLAPDCDGLLPTRCGPTMPAPAPATIALSEWQAIDPPSVDGLARAILFGIAGAGPIFAAAALMLDQTARGDRWWDPLQRAAASLLAFPFTLTFGAMLAAIPVALGVVTLGSLGRTTAALRTPVAWAATGGAMGAGIATLFGAGGPVGLALVATSVACARIARFGVQWIDPKPA